MLVNNGGINSQGVVTEDGLEVCFQTNFVEHFLFTKLLLPQLTRAKNIYYYQVGNGSSRGIMEEVDEA
jgi:NAD(P)-dependent dehydrogenase (short-subunit alcohol dehydrogenase family)